ncbi:MAG: hypothetical protein R2828_24310 [Saprospiraceae bacterium]
MKKLEGIKTRNIGPAGMSGRVTSIDALVSNPEVIYIGTASGGVWHSKNGGISWKPIFDKEAVQSIGAVAINQNNPSEIWVGTGEGNPRNSQNSGAGIYRSLDGGQTWKLMGLEKTKTIHRIIIHRDNPAIVYVGAQGSAWGPNEERGIYRTKDGGQSWDKVLYVNAETGCADLVVDPTNPNKLIAAMWEYGRKPWSFNSGGKGSGLYVSHDGGSTWDLRTNEDGLPKGDLGRIGLAIAPSKPNIVYALVEAKENGLYKSTDGGKKWELVSTKNIGGRPFYYADIFVDPKNENRIYNLHSLVDRSEDGGKTFTTILPYFGVHPDHHAFWVHPDNPNLLMEGNDGGLNISRDGGDNWRFVTNLPLAQLYHVNYDMEIPYNIGGGMQDNGTWVGPSSVWKAGGITNADWQEVFFGDGFDLMFKRGSSRFVYAMSQGGNVGYVDRTTGGSRFIKPVHPDDVKLRFHWNAAIAQDPFNECGLYFGSQFVHYSQDCGANWTILSPDLTTNDTSKQKQDVSGGLTIDATGAENHTTILAIAPSPRDRNVIWVGTDDGNLQLTKDGGKTWTNLLGHLPGVKPGSWIPYIEVSQKNRAEAFVIVNDYRRNDWRPMVFHTTDFGATFKQIADEKKVSGHALSIVQDPIASNLLWLGTDFGLYFTIDGGDNWNQWNHDFPAVSTRDLKIHSRDHDLIIATFGRAFWILDDLRPFRAIAQSKGQVLDQAFAVFDAPDAYLAEFRSFQGIRFAADADYSGDNKGADAMLTVWVKEEDKAAQKKNNEAAAAGAPLTDGPRGRRGGAGGGGQNKAKIQVVDAKGDTIRTFTRELKSGMNRISWPLNRDGVSFPSRRPDRPDADPPSGGSVLPGVYEVHISYGKHKGSTLVTVHPDPRKHTTLTGLQTREEIGAEYNKMVEKATMGFKQLQEAKATIKLVNDAMVNAPDTIKKQLAKSGKAMQDSLDMLEKLYMSPDDLKGIQRSSDNLNGALSGVRRYLSDVEGEPSQMVKLTMEKARKETKMVLDKLNAFFEGDFAAYQKAVEAVSFSLFKPREAVKLEE